MSATLITWPSPACRIEISKLLIFTSSLYSNVLWNSIILVKTIILIAIRHPEINKCPRTWSPSAAAEMLFTISLQTALSDSAAGRFSRGSPVSRQMVSGNVNFLLLLPRGFGFQWRVKEQSSFVAQWQWPATRALLCLNVCDAGFMRPYVIYSGMAFPGNVLSAT